MGAEGVSDEGKQAWHTEMAPAIWDGQRCLQWVAALTHCPCSLHIDYIAVKPTLPENVASVTAEHRRAAACCQRWCNALATDQAHSC